MTAKTPYYDFERHDATDSPTFEGQCNCSMNGVDTKVTAESLPFASTTDTRM